MATVPRCTVIYDLVPWGAQSSQYECGHVPGTVYGTVLYMYMSCTYFDIHVVHTYMCTYCTHTYTMVPVNGLYK